MQQLFLQVNTGQPTAVRDCQVEKLQGNAPFQAQQRTDAEIVALFRPCFAAAGGRVQSHRVAVIAAIPPTAPGDDSDPAIALPRLRDAIVDHLRHNNVTGLQSALASEAAIERGGYEALLCVPDGECRVDPADGEAYAFADFIAQYSADRAVTTPPTFYHAYVHAATKIRA
eukprot:gene14799-60752_t